MPLFSPRGTDSMLSLLWNNYNRLQRLEVMPLMEENAIMYHMGKNRIGVLNQLRRKLLAEKFSESDGRSKSEIVYYFNHFNNNGAIKGQIATVQLKVKWLREMLCVEMLRVAMDLRLVNL